jgi:hypothetical protein
MNTKPVSSPASTGGEGTFFEQHVNAYCLALLLVEAIPPVFLRTTITEVSFQTEHLGWATDDVLLGARTGAGELRRLAGQVKKTLTISASDEDFSDAITDAWTDFSNQDLFDRNRDALLLITQLGTTALLKHFVTLLDCARASSTADDFEHRLTTTGFVRAQVRTYGDEVRKIVQATAGAAVSLADLWPFLRTLYVISLDLNTPAGLIEGHVKTLLAHTSSEADRAGAAEATWNALLKEAGSAMPKAKTYVRADLPEDVRHRHRAMSATDHQALAALREHSTVIVENVRTLIGADLHLPRPTVVQAVLDRLEESRVVLVSGPAGSGKSSAAKAAVQALSEAHYVFAFRAEELARAHLDEALAAAQIPVRAAELSAITAAHPRKILLVESVERLLEASTRDAFADLLALVQRDPTWRLILTCRDYSVDLVRAAFLHTVGVYAKVDIPPLTDEELQAVEANHPVIARLLANARLRTLLRNPYTLDMAMHIDWERDDELPATEREFRGKFWRHFVRADHRREQAMPQRRADAFTELSARRARALSLYAPTQGLDPQALAALHGDGLVVVAPESDALAAPAHDVLEDWGVLEWISGQHAASSGAPDDLATRLGGYPAIRRTYRNWVAELIARDEPAADTLFDRAITEELPAHFRDDTVLAFLKSDHVPEVLDRHAAHLVADGRRLLHRVIHLLRVGCVKLPEWLSIPNAPSSILLQPEGAAWPAVLRLVQRNLAALTGEDRPLLMGLVEDWAKSVSWRAPYPEGHEAAAAIAVWLMPSERAMKMLTKIPASAADDVAAALRRREGPARDREVQFHNRLVDDFRTLIFGGVECTPVARDLPDLTIEIGREYMLASDEDVDADNYDHYGSGIDTELWFGIKKARSLSFFPPSALHGPFRSLLFHHPDKALTFIIEIFNHSADWYAHPRIPMGLEPAFEITLTTLADGTTKTQWCNARLWNLYRGFSVAPYLLQSAAMALEAWLFEISERDVTRVEPILIRILLESNSVALTGVAASVATAYPHACGDVLLALLSSPICIALDRARMVQEMSAHLLGGMLSQHDPIQELYAEERAVSNARPHRQEDLEAAIAKLQLTPFAARVHEAIDAHRTQLPPVESQTEEDRFWRLALHRMDLRGYTVTETTQETLRAADAAAPAVPEGSKLVVLSGTIPDTDLQEMIAEGATRDARIGARLGLYLWGFNVFAGEQSERYHPDTWREKLTEAMSGAHTAPEDGEVELVKFGAEGAGLIAAVCVRDYWAELSSAERKWCVRLVCDDAAGDANAWQERYAAEAEAAPAAASVLPYIVAQQPKSARVLRAFACALTHPRGGVRRAAARGAARYFWPANADLALRSVRALAIEAVALQKMAEAKKKSSEPRRNHNKLRAEAAEVARRHIQQPWEEENDPLLSYDPSEWYGAEATLLVLTILSSAPHDAMTIAAFKRLTETVVEWWDEDAQSRGRTSSRSDETESALTDLLEDFVLKVSSAAVAADVLQPLLDAVDRHADKLQWFIYGIVAREDRQPSTDRFWFVWQLFADRLARASWIARVDDRYSRGLAFLAKIFLAVDWKKNTRHWKSLTGHAERLHKLFEALPVSKAVLHQYVRFLYHIGEESLPTAYIRIAAKLKSGDRRVLLDDNEMVFMLESVLQRQVYSKPVELKRREDLRMSILYLLDQLVDSGSSAAFRMRDDFVTPLPLLLADATPAREE